MASSIDFGAIISRSRDLTFKNKWLWVYGLVIAVFTGSSFNSGGGGGSSSSSSSKSSTINITPSNISEQGKKVLGDATNLFTQWVSSIPPQTWLLLIIGVLLLIILGLIIQWVALNWAKGALIRGIEDADAGEKVELSTTTKYGIKSLKDLFIFSLISGAMSLGIMFVLLAVYGLIALVLSYVKTLMVLWLVAAGIIGFFALIVMFVIFAMVVIYAERLVVLEGYAPWNAWKKGLSLSKGNFGNTVLMGLINSAIGCSVGCASSIVIFVVLLIPGIIFAIPFFSNEYPPVSIAGIVMLFLIFLFASMIVRAGIVVFNYSNWNQIFKKIYEK
ncbi:hypothetical protein HY310_00380 [Candidatus Microgenomates bacterium]|nr:hypothetical protein [Candidatus Microgenomates bacterium]